MRNIEIQGWGGEKIFLFIDPIEIQVVNGRIILITGPNGSGKTSIFDLLSYALHGITSKGLKGDDVVNDRIEKDCYAWAKFKIDNDQYKVDRYRMHHEYGNNVFLYKNGERDKVGDDEVKECIDRIFMPHKLLMNLIFFSQKVKSFFTDLPDSEKKEIFRKILLLDNYIDYYKEVNVRLDKIDTLLSEVRNNQTVTVSLIKDSISEIERIELRKKEFLIKREKEVSDMIDNIMSGHDKLLQLQKKLLDVISEQDLQKSLEDITRRTSEIEMRSKIIDSKFQEQKDAITISKSSRKSEIEKAKHISEKEIIDKKSKTLSDFQSDYNDLRLLYNNQTSKLNQDISNRNSKITADNDLIKLHKTTRDEIFEKVFSKSVSTCPTCSQEISEEVVEKLRTKMNFLNQEISNLEEDIKKCRFDIESISSKKQRLNETFSTQTNDYEINVSEIETRYNNNMIDLQNRIQISFKRLNEMEQEKVKELEEERTKEKSNLSSLDSLVKEKKDVMLVIESRKQIENEISSVKSKIDSDKKVLEYKQVEIFDGDSSLIVQKARQKKLQDSLEKLSIQMTTLEKKSRILNFLKKAFSPTGIPSMLIDDSIPFINETVSKYLDDISNGRYIVSFDTRDETKGGNVRDKIRINVLDTVTLANKREKLSGGQTRVVDIATILTLSELQSIMQDVSINILLFDEIFDSLDNNNISYVARVLKEVSRNKAIFIISHQHIDLLEADDILRMS